MQLKFLRTPGHHNAAYQAQHAQANEQIGLIAFAFILNAQFYSGYLHGLTAITELGDAVNAKNEPNYDEYNAKWIFHFIKVCAPSFGHLLNPGQANHWLQGELIQPSQKELGIHVL